MSTILHWKPMDGGGALPGNAHGDLARRLGDVFGEFPLRLDSDHYQLLKAMAAAADNPEPYEFILEQLTTYDSILIEYST